MLGAGGVAEVLGGCAADGPAEGRIAVALKRVAPEQARHPEMGPLLVGALRAEGQLLGRLRHPNVVALIEQIDEPPVLVLERLVGRTLSELVGQGALPIDLALELGAQAAAALAAVHALCDDEGRGLCAVHCDVSPDNLFVTDEGCLKLFDFGVASYRGCAATGSGALKGRVAYMAPEQAKGEQVDGSADVFALGTVIWELLVGRRLFWRGNTLASLRALLDEPIPLVTAEARAPVPPAVAALLPAMLARDPGQRPGAAEIERGLRALLPPDATRLASLAARARVI